MAFRTDFTLNDAFLDARLQAKQIKGRMQSAVTALAGNVNANQVFSLVDDIRTCVTLLTADAAIPGIGPYAQAQYDSATYDVATEFNNMLAALNSVISWVVTNFPKDSQGFAQAYTLQADGTRVAAVFTPAQTAGLTSALNAAITNIS